MDQNKNKRNDKQEISTRIWDIKCLNVQCRKQEQAIKALFNTVCWF